MLRAGPPPALVAYVAIVVLGSAAAPAVGAEPRAAVPKATRIAGSVWLVQVGGGNVAAAVGDAGTVLVDGGTSADAAPIRDALVAGGAAPGPVRYVLDTHWHSDHTGGNGGFARRGATILAQDATRRRLASGSASGNGGSVHYPGKKADPDDLPGATFGTQVTLYTRDEEIYAEHVPRAHTDGDVIVVFRRSGVAHAGDVFVRYGFPYIDVESGGSIDGMIAACRRLLDLLPADARIIPGHGAVASTGDLREYLAMLEGTRAVVAAGLADGKSLERMKAERVLDRWSTRYAGRVITTDAFLETLYYSLRETPRD